ncbi:MAG: 50S ribosomal protein L21e [Candidatus Micrarchaeota archaeon]|nr:50S ribosomal protein L21e [Candidatus Micrarchaeota archaeon]
MVHRSTGYKRGTRRTFKRDFRSKFKVTPFIEKFEINQKVIIDQNPFSQESMPHFRFKGKIGVVTEKRGRALVVKVSDGKKEKTVIVTPEHLRAAG